MKISKMGSAVAAAALSLGFVSAASAYSITAGDYVFLLQNYDSGTTGYGNTIGQKCGSAGSVAANIMQCDNVPGITVAPGSTGSVNSSADTLGIFSIESITNITTNSVIFQRASGNYITGVFGNIADYKVAVTDDGFGVLSTTTLGTGGKFAMYRNTSDYDPSLGPGVTASKDLNALKYPGISDTGSLFLSGVFSAGSRAGDFDTSYTSTYNNASFAGHGQSFLDVTGGSAYSNFNTDKLTDANGNMHDMFLDVTYNDVSGAASKIGWSVTSAGQIKGNAIPEPGVLALVSLALLGLGLTSRRRNS